MSAEQSFAIVITSIVTWGWVAARVVRGPLDQAWAVERVLFRDREVGRFGQGDAL